VEFGNPKLHFSVIEEYGSRVPEIFFVVALTFILILERSKALDELDLMVMVSFHESLHSGS
jgi:hypothetical protein